MGLSTAQDAKRIAELSRATFARTLSYLERLPDAGWSAQSACSDWKVYQVVSHIGSQPLIVAGVLAAGLRGAAPMQDQERRAIWAHFDGLGPLEVLPEFRRGNEEFWALVDTLSDDELGSSVSWIYGDSPVAMVLASRLGEQALHEWDIRWPEDRSSRLDPAAVPTLLELNLTAARLKTLARPERSEALRGRAIELTLAEDGSVVTMQLEPENVTVASGRAAAAALRVKIPAERLVRLIWNRLDLPAEVAAGSVKLDRPELVGELQNLFPGR